MKIKEEAVSLFRKEEFNFEKFLPGQRITVKSSSLNHSYFTQTRKFRYALTVNNVNYSDSTVVHEATTPWVESVNSTQFTAYVTRAGRNDYPSDSFATVDWVAYQGAPSGGLAGVLKMLFATIPTGSRLRHDVTSVWLEDVTATSFKIFLRELQNFAGVHEDISVVDICDSIFPVSFIFLFEKRLITEQNSLKNRTFYELCNVPSSSTTGR
ncbi:hypothetical protein pdam_00002799 [Pocillopora damicornis]|uniref:Uncharacterized protein n=1 Tax=Pocillopora damicornis TaxID=46731 RepID=A0A3M6TT47_POCDA|nr:hypothetical protein pdam_00002799 [Pocillopora damicornis]